MSAKTYDYKVLAYQGKTIFGKIVMGSFGRIEKYFQEDESCFMFVENGDFLLRTPDKTIRFEAGEGLLAKCGNYFFEDQQEISVPEKRTVLIAAYFYPEIIKELFTEDFISPKNQNNYDADKIKIDHLLVNFKQGISFLLDNPELADEALILTKLKEFLILLSKAKEAESVLEFLGSLFKPYEYSFKTIIENNAVSNLSLQELAMLCGMSLATFKRRFSEYYSVSPKKYLLEKKMEKAVQLLSIKENRIADIAYGCGFESVGTFNRNFKSFYGKSPTEFSKH